MSSLKLQFVDKFQAFWTNLQSVDFRSRELLIPLAGWLVSFVLVISPLRLPINLDFLFYVAHVFFWFKVIELVHTRLSPPNELLLLLFLLFSYFELLFLQSLLTSGSVVVSVQEPNAFFSFVQIFMVSMLILFFSVLLISNSRGKGGVVWFALLALLGIYIESSFYMIVLQVILFIALLRKTAWLEELTKQECWLYLLVLGYMLYWFGRMSFLPELSGSRLTESVLWFRLPRFLFATLKLYLLALVVKIPVVLVYNFASLSRKLRISSLFQSTFPQLIQLAMLLFIFYFFIAGWQAEKVRKAILNQVDETMMHTSSDSRVGLKVPFSGDETVLQVRGHEAVHLSRTLPTQGILKLERQPSLFSYDSFGYSYFVFEKVFADEESFLYLVQLDSTFLSNVAATTSILAGSDLQAYAYEPPLWESYLYNAAFWMQEKEFLIFPFGLIPQKRPDAIMAVFPETDYRMPDWVEETNSTLRGLFSVTAGRVIVPLLDANAAPTGFFAFEIRLFPGISFFTVTFANYLLLLLIIYTLVNILVVRRMSRFGSEINRMIVQRFNQLKSGIREISTGNLDYKVKLEGRDEFVELADRFNTMGDRLKDSIAEARDRERLQHELTIARNVQLGMLPRALPQIPGYQIAATLETANEVGGDFYDVLKLSEHRYLFTIGDVSGKSTSAAFYMAQCISLIRFSQQFTQKPREIALRLNSYFADPLVDRQIFVTAIVGILDTEKNTLTFVRTGHTPPVLLPGEGSKDIVEVRSEGLGIGIERSGQLFEKHLADEVIKLGSGDTLFFYTDGLVEASHKVTDGVEEEPSTQFYGETRLFELLKTHRGSGATELFKTVSRDVTEFYNGQSPVDDYTLLLIQKE